MHPIGISEESMHSPNEMECMVHIAHANNRLNILIWYYLFSLDGAINKEIQKIEAKMLCLMIKVNAGK